jgi:N-acetylmuramoyl-L-alanine amidase
MVLGLSRQTWPICGLLFAVTLLASPALAEQKDAATAPAGAAAAVPADATAAVPHVADATPGAVEKSTTDTAAGKVQRTRFLVGLERSTKFTVRALTNPNRVIVDVDETKLQLPGDLGGKTVGVISSFRAGISGPNQSRIIIDVTEPVYIESSKMEKAPDGKGHRLALSIVTAESPKKAMKAPFALGAAGLQPPMPVPAVRPEISAAKAFKPIIVIDPGHGGHDSGAMKHGTVEKDVVLAFSKVLREKLEATGRYKVMMTRDTDVFVELGDRVKYGEKHNASLFIAVHADYATTKASGATIYSLRESVGKGLKRSAKGDMTDNALSGTELKSVKESAASDFDMGAIKGILSDLAGREVEATQERTTLFSRSVVEYMGSSTNMRDDPDQQAAFRVLKTAQFPSVLIELGYVTNSKDAGNLNSNEWRGKVADSIMTAVDNYFSQQIARLPM